MPMNVKEYPDNWEWLSAQVRKRNRGRCELCFAQNGDDVYRQKDGISFYPWSRTELPESKKVTIVLTVHHIDNDKKNNTERNLISLCQKCHCRLNLADHIKHSKETRMKKRLAKGISLI